MINFSNIHVNYKNAKLLLKWRRKDYIQTNSLTNVRASTKKQISWLKNSHYKKDYHHWFIKFKKKRIGWICLTEPNLKSKSIRWGYYVGEKKYFYLGVEIPCYLFNFIFFNLKFKKIIAETLTNNMAMDKILKFQGFKKTNTIKKFTTKKGKSVDRHNLDLTLKYWLKQKQFHKYKYNFKLPKNKKILNTLRY